ncbi:nucleotidyltransferase domain-containing protein [Aquipuribacter sp. SD81]|uniref:nucleotidyltransferase domain-containing protein n=1 Tax=Aquipuribacter sp. SD81 TaxID=3127703 RepID=UPI003016E0F7
MRRAEAVPLPAGLSADDLRAHLRAAGAVVAFLHGSRVAGTARPDSDVDVAAWFGRSVPGWDVPLPTGVDLLVLDDAGLELAGRVAQYGALLLDDDPPTRVAWQADRAKRYLDEAHRRREIADTVFGRRR